MFQKFPILAVVFVFVFVCGPYLTAQSGSDVQDENVVHLRPLVVTSQQETIPLTVELDASAAIQPIPASDGADFLKHVPGFSMIRKGGIDGDPVFRGLGGSRLSVCVDGETILGGCGQRMDPPTAYVFPNSFDRVVITKGPQTVKYGPGNSAGMVRFERDIPTIGERAGYEGDVYSNVASFGRLDVGGEFEWYGEQLYTRVHSTHSRADDYDNGDGKAVHSAYERWSVGATVGGLATAETYVELSVNTSDGEAGYADRAMDGVKFDRENLSLRVFQDFAKSDLLEGLEAQVYYNYVDHIMDNYSLRTFSPSAMMPNPAASNPDRLTYGGKVTLNLSPVENCHWTVGADVQINEHSIRKTMNQVMMPFEAMDRSNDAKFEQLGLFVEADRVLSDEWKLIWGGRVDLYSAEDLRKKINVKMVGNLDNPTADNDRSETLPSGFLRIERETVDLGQLYAGVGYVSRFPDYWELFSKESTESLSAFGVAPEKTLQLDLGWIFERENYAVSISGFAADHSDFILIESAYQKPTAMGSRGALISRNVDASTRGVEASLLLRSQSGLYLTSSLAYVHGENETEGTALAQIPPLEGRIELGYRGDTFSGGFLARFVDEQDRYAKNQGNIVGQDIGPSDGFSVYSLHGSYRINEQLSIAAGVDNLFDEAYAEHLSRAGGSVAGFTQTTRVYEPGRVAWVRADFKF